MKPRPRKCGKGYITSYDISIGSAAARRCGFIDETGERLELETVEMPDEKTLIVRVKQ